MPNKEERSESFVQVLPLNLFKEKTNLNPYRFDDSPEKKDYEVEKSRHQIKDICWKIRARKYFSAIFTSILLVQNGFVGWLIVASLQKNILPEIKGILSIIVPATLLETAYIIKIVITWIFSNIDYFDHKKTE